MVQRGMADSSKIALLKSLSIHLDQLFLVDNPNPTKFFQVAMRYLKDWKIEVVLRPNDIFVTNPIPTKNSRTDEMVVSYIDEERTTILIQFCDVMVRIIEQMHKQGVKNEKITTDVLHGGILQKEHVTGKYENDMLKVIALLNYETISFSDKKKKYVEVMKTYYFIDGAVSELMRYIQEMIGANSRLMYSREGGRYTYGNQYMNKSLRGADEV